MFYIKKKNSLQELKKEEKKMKIKKGLALILALAMIITLMPTMAFATTANSAVDSYVPVKADSLMPSTTIDLRAEQNLKDTKIHFTLELNNAEWNIIPDRVGGAAGNTNAFFPSVESGKTARLLEVNIISEKAVIATSGLVFKNATKDTLDFELELTEPLKINESIQLVFGNKALRAGSNDGEISVEVNVPTDSQITGGTVKIAEVVSGNSVASTDPDDIKIYPRGSVTGAPIEITETTVNALNGTEVIRLRLPSGVTWETEGVAPVILSGTLLGDTTVSISTRVSDPDKINNPVANLSSGEYFLSDDERTLTFAFATDGRINNVDSLFITPNIYISKDAREGDIAVTLIGLTNVTDADDLVIAAYGSELVDVTTVEEVPTIVSGYVTDTKDKNFTVSVTLKENMKNAMSAGRYVDFDLPEEVQICGPIEVKLNKYDQDTATENVTIEGSNTNRTSISEDTSGFEFQVPGGYNNANYVVKSGETWKIDRANTITFEIPVTVEAGFTGDITMTVTGAKAGVEDTELVVATAEAPITVETSTTNVKNGVQTQTVADITITENFPGYMEDGDVLYLGIDTLGLDGNSVVFESFDSIEVTDGNLEIGRCKVDESQIRIPIDVESTEVSTIELKGLTVALNRTLPEGGYDLQATGSAVVKNTGYNVGDFSDVAVTTEDYVNITTPADDSAGMNATFTDGQASYTLNGQTVEMDVAPYIDSNNRMMVPIRYAANAMGVSDSNIQWNSYTQTGTISGAMGVVQVTVGNTSLITSNGTITMDTVAVNRDNRIYVPVRYIANALGASVSWDPATRTATFS